VDGLYDIEGSLIGATVGLSVGGSVGKMQLSSRAGTVSSFLQRKN